MTPIAFMAATIGVLAAPPSGMAPCTDPPARQFDFWLGEWDVRNRYRVEGQGWTDAGTAVDKVFAVVGGCAVVELWDGNLGRTRLRGFSVRTYDPQRRRWILVLNWPQTADAVRFTTLEGGFRHGRGEFERHGADPEQHPVLIRYTFSDITDSTLRWNDGLSRDSGRTWRTNWIMEFRRRSPINDPPLLDHLLGDELGPRLCTDPPTRAFDGALGLWDTSDSAGIGRGARLTSASILAGCGVMDVLEWTDEQGRPQSMFLVRSWVPADRAWVQFALSTAAPGVTRYAGSDPHLLTETTSGDSRMRWSLESGRLRITFERADTAGGGWRPERRFEFRRK